MRELHPASIWEVRQWPSKCVHGAAGDPQLCQAPPVPGKESGQDGSVQRPYRDQAVEPGHAMECIILISEQCALAVLCEFTRVPNTQVLASWASLGGPTELPQ